MRDIRCAGDSHNHYITSECCRKGQHSLCTLSQCTCPHHKLDDLVGGNQLLKMDIQKAMCEGGFAPSAGPWPHPRVM